PLGSSYSHIKSTRSLRGSVSPRYSRPLMVRQISRLAKVGLRYWFRSQGRHRGLALRYDGNCRGNLPWLPFGQAEGTHTGRPGAYTVPTPRAAACSKTRRASTPATSLRYSALAWMSDSVSSSAAAVVATSRNSFGSGFC